MMLFSLIKNNELEIDESGIGELPDEFEKVSEDGEVIVYQNDEEGTLVGFWIFRGIGTSSELLLYSSLDEKFIKDSLGSNIISIKKLNDNWYYVVME